MLGLESAARIAEVRAVPVRVPITRAGTMSGAKRTHAARTIVEVVADDGTVGLGETRTEEAAAIVNRRFAPSLVGAGAFDRRGARARCLRAHPDYGFPEQRLDAIAFSAVEIAQWDLLGKRARLPLYSLLGARYATRRRSWPTHMRSIPTRSRSRRTYRGRWRRWQPTRWHVLARHCSSSRSGFTRST